MVRKSIPTKEKTMSDQPRKKPFAEEVERLERLRDELVVQAHLSKADAKKEFGELEKKFDKLKRDARPVRHAAEETVGEVGDATRLLFDTVWDGMNRIRKSLK
jgi:hypothetical protein